MKKRLGLTAFALIAAGCSGSGGGGNGGSPTPTPTPTGMHFHWDNPAYTEPAGLEEYQCFYVDVPTGGTANGQVGAYQFSYAPAAGLHHMVVFTDTDTSHPNGSNAQCTTLIASTWTVRYAGGTTTDPLTLPAGVAMPMNGPTQRFVFQLHLLNAGSTDLPIHTSVDIDFTAPTDTYTHAQVVIAGTNQISIPPNSGPYPITGTCTLPQGIPTVHSFAAWPHMHKLGTNFKIELTHASTTTTLLDKPWTFGDQPMWYPAGGNLDLSAGDTITTTCTYNNTTNATVSFGEFSGDEMCFDFFYYYPAIIDQTFPCF